MSLAVVIELASAGGFRARTGEPLPIEVFAETSEEALAKLRAEVRQRRLQGVVIVELDEPEHPWARFAGALKDDPLHAEWKQAMQDYRDQVDLEESPHEFADMIGFLKDEPLFDEWQQEIQNYREEVDAQEAAS